MSGEGRITIKKNGRDVDIEILGDWNQQDIARSLRVLGSEYGKYKTVRRRESLARQEKFLADDAVKARELEARNAAANLEKTEQIDEAALLAERNAKLKSDYEETVTKNLKISAARKQEISPDKLSEEDLSTIAALVKKMVEEKFPKAESEGEAPGPIKSSKAPLQDTSDSSSGSGAEGDAPAPKPNSVR